MEDKQLLYLDELDLKGICKDLIHNVWIIILAVLAATLLTRIIYIPEEKVQYTSNAAVTILSREAPEGESKLSVSADMAAALAQIFSSDVLKNGMRAELGYEPVGSLQVSWTEKTNLVKLQMTAEDAEEARRELQIILELYEPFAGNMFHEVDLFVLSEPSMPQFPSNRNNSLRDMILSAAAVGGICALMIIAMSVFRKTVKTKASVIRWIHSEYYGSIVYSADSESLAESFQRLVSRIVYHMEHSHQKILMITSTAENEGAFMVASNMAAAMAGRGKKILLVDADSGTGMYRVFKPDRGSKMTEWQIDMGTIQEFLSEQRNAMDYIIVIHPAIGAVGVDGYLACLADTSLFVIRRDYLQIDEINDAIDKIKSSGMEMSGCILNNMNKA